MKLTPIFPIVVLSLAPVVPAVAQLVPDNTLGAESSVVTPVGTTGDRIEGGAAQGSNLFHSFSEFNVDAGRRVDFANPTGIENILTRVTGGNPSNILGTLGVLGEANLFLVNPNGIIFGPDASLDIRGSFFATTGDSIKLGTEGIFSATNLEGSQLLQVKPEAIFTNAMANHMAELNSQAGLAVGPGSTLALHGGEVTISGELGGGKVEVRGNNISIGEGGINLSARDVGWQGNNDITVNADVMVGEGNSLTLEAGRSIEIAENSRIDLDGGDLTARINSEKAQATARDEGVAQFMMRPGSQILTNGGDVTIDHGTFGDIAVGEVRLNESIINASAVSLDIVGGDIAIVGRGRDRDSSDNYGIMMQGNVTVETTATGNIDITGTGGAGRRRNHGVFMRGGASIKAVDGDISIRGTGGNATERFNLGVNMQQNILMESTGSGNIIVTGKGGGGIRFNEGVKLNNTEIYSVDGNIELTGTGSSVGNENIGINGNVNTIASRGKGNISLVGTVGGESNNYGIRLRQNNNISTDRGDITINGTGNGTGNDNIDIRIDRISTLESKTGNIILIGRGAGEGIELNEVLINRETGTGTVTMQAESIDISNSQLRGGLQFQPREGNLSLTVESSEILSSQEVIIGSYNSRGTIAIEGNLLFAEPVTILSPGGAIDTTAATLVGLDEATFTLTANQNISTGNIFNPDGTVSINSSDGTVDTSGGIIIDINNPPSANTPTTLRPDRTLGAESTVVVPIDANNNRIEGGATRGSTKLHSFAQFNIESGRGVYFQGEDGIANIISRVTGDDPSNIFGTLGVERDANLFLLNPNGTLFAPGASLDLKGSLVTTSATAMGLGNGEIFSSNGAIPIPRPNLNVNPQALLFASNNPGQITVQSNLEVSEGQSLLLVGGEVLLGGDFLDTFTLGGQLNAPGGRIELAGLADAVEIGLELNGDQIKLEIPEAPRANISVIDGSIANVAAGGGGDIVVTGHDVEVSGVSMTNNSSLLRGGMEIDRGTADARAGDININATGEVNISTSGRYLSARTLDETPDKLASQEIRRNEISGGVVVNSLRRGSAGNAGNINITGGQVNVTGPALSCCLSRSNRAIQSILWPGNSGNAGNITIRAETIDIDRVTISSSNRSGNLGNAGNILIEASDKTHIFGSAIQALINGDILFNGELYGAEFNSAGNGGNITIRANNLLIEGGSSIDTSNQGDFGDTGIISLEAEQMQVVAPFFRTAIAGEGDSGSINFAGQSVEITGGGNSRPGVAASGGLIEAQTFGPSQGSEINIRGESVRLNRDVRLSTETLGSGNGGTINIFATNFELADAATIGASSQAQGNAGNINIAADEITISGAIDTTPTALLSVADAAGDAGNITVNARNFQISEGAALNTRTNGEGAGGNITVNADRFQARTGGQLISVTLGNQKAGNIAVNADEVTLEGFDPTFAERTEGIVFETQTARERIAADNILRTGRQGTIVNNQITIVGAASGLYAGTLEDATGDGGEINVTARKLTISDTAAINVDTAGSGRGGDININASEIRLENRGDINSATLSGVGGGNINIGTQDLRLDENSNISTNAGGEGNGGNITINAETILALDDSFISANAVEGRGGNIRISSKGVFLDNSSQITATSDRGIDGRVEINDEVDPAKGLEGLDNNPLDPEKILAQNFCVLAKESSFIITGRGGIHQNHTDRLQSQVTWQDLRLPEEDDTVAGSHDAVNENPEEILIDDEIRQAQGWVQLPDGTVVLTSYPVIPTPHGPLLQHPGCNIR